jgi:hypothetical protein
MTAFLFVPFLSPFCSFIETLKVNIIGLDTTFKYYYE